MVAFLPFGPDQQLSRTIIDGAHRVQSIAEQIQNDLLQLNSIGRDQREIVGKFSAHDHPRMLDLPQ